ncbi:hypothetical protein WJX74_009978 [Apatococcus lobatus]|uniref:GATA-type domain-containing protein n=1 Tax=Apatococcus lobatus TaxID=904363 RepID=A0AAW1SHV5_9CHLO
MARTAVKAKRSSPEARKYLQKVNQSLLKLSATEIAADLALIRGDKFPGTHVLLEENLQGQQEPVTPDSEAGTPDITTRSLRPRSALFKRSWSADFDWSQDDSKARKKQSADGACKFLRFASSGSLSDADTMEHYNFKAETVIHGLPTPWGVRGKKQYHGSVNMEVSLETPHHHDGFTVRPKNAPEPMATAALAPRCEDCDTADTPQWRSGPSGPKSLCNACGIRLIRAQERPTVQHKAAPCGSASLRVEKASYVGGGPARDAMGPSS